MHSCWIFGEQCGVLCSFQSWLAFIFSPDFSSSSARSQYVIALWSIEWIQLRSCFNNHWVGLTVMKCSCSLSCPHFLESKMQQLANSNSAFRFKMCRCLRCWWGQRRTTSIGSTGTSTTTGSVTRSSSSGYWMSSKATASSGRGRSGSPPT